MSLPYSHPLLENLRKEKHKYRNIHTVIQRKREKFLNIHTVIQRKKEKFLKEESEVIKKIPRLDIIRQIYSQIPILYELNSATSFISPSWKITKVYIKTVVGNDFNI